MNTARRDDDDGGKVALECQQGVEFNSGFVTAERGPRKQRKAAVNGGGVQRVTGDTLVELVFGEAVHDLGEDGATFVHKVKNRWLAV